MPQDVAVLSVVLVSTMALLWVINGVNESVGENAIAVHKLNFHRHNSGRETTTFPVNRDGELIHTLDGIRGWY